MDIKFTDNGQSGHIRTADVRSKGFMFINPTTKSNAEKNARQFQRAEDKLKKNRQTRT